MARGKRNRVREEASEEEAVAPGIVEEAGKVEEEEARKAEEPAKAEADDRGEDPENRGSVEEEEDKDEAGRQLLLSRCKSVLQLLMDYRHAWLFNEPVDPVALEIPDYPSVIKYPMDLGTIKEKLEQKEYRDLPVDFINDVQLTFDNAMLYNPPGHDVHTAAKRMLGIFEKEWSKSASKSTVAPTPKSADTNTPKSAAASTLKSAAASIPKSAARSTPKGAAATTPRTPRQQGPAKSFSFEEKQTLLENLQSLPPHMQHAAVLLMREKSPHVDWSGEEVDVQLDLLDNMLLQELEEHVNKCMKSAVSSDRKRKQALGSSKARGKGKQRRGKGKAEEEEDELGIVIDVPVSLFPPQKAT